MEQIQKELEEFPEGKLNYSCVGDRVKWYCRINKQKQYIPVADIDFAKTLAIKRYLTLQQNNLSKNLQACNSFLKHYEHSPIESFLSDSPIARHLLPAYFSGTDDSDTEWAQSDYEKCNLYPDFTILHPKTQKIIYWEHFGMMNDMGYRKDTFEKMDKYISFGIFPSVQLITTYEDYHHPLSYEDVEKIVQHFLLS